MKHILVEQAKKLVQERWFTVQEAVNIAYEQQLKRWTINKDASLSLIWQEYSNLSSKEREEIRSRVDRWEDFKTIMKEWIA